MLSDQVLFEELISRTWIFFVALIFSFLSTSFAWLVGFFRKPEPTIVSVKGIDVIKGFSAFLLAQLILIPAIIVVFFTLADGPGFNLTRIDQTTRGWLNLLVIVGSFCIVYSVFLTIPLSRREAVWGDSSVWYRHVSLGILTWFISFPLVTAFNQLVSMIVLWVFRQPQVEQVAVQHIRTIASDRWLFGLTFLGVIILVPILEELLFRGLLQSWLKLKIGRMGWAIALTSLIFALFHYSTSQGFTNIELLSSLFLLSCFLGYLYERQHSLWASIGLHGFFNAMSIWMISE